MKIVTINGVPAQPIGKLDLNPFRAIKRTTNFVQNVVKDPVKTIKNTITTGLKDIRDDVVKPVYRVASRAGLSVPRNAFLGIVALNIRGLATILNQMLQDPASKNRLFNVWVNTAGGVFSAFENAIKKGASRRPVLAGVIEIDQKGAIGADPGTLSIIASAASILAMIMPIINDFRKSRREPEISQTEVMQSTEIQARSGNLDSFIAPENKNTVLLLAAVGLGAYLLTKK
jgi:hypothetical protein